MYDVSGVLGASFWFDKTTPPAWNGPGRRRKAERRGEVYFLPVGGGMAPPIASFVFP